MAWLFLIKRSGLRKCDIGNVNRKIKEYSNTSVILYTRKRNKFPGIKDECILFNKLDWNKKGENALMEKQRKDPCYNAEQLWQELMKITAEVYRRTGEMRLTAQELEISELKVRKLLITAGEYENQKSAEIGRLFREGMTVREIQALTGLGKSSINGYLPYTKAVYNAKEISRNAERIRKYRARKMCIEELLGEPSEERLWQAVIEFQNYPFTTFSGLFYTYQLKVGKNGSYNKEILISRRRQSKSLTWSSVRLAFEGALRRKGEVIEKPKALGDIRGISYIYPIFVRFGLIQTK